MVQQSREVGCELPSRVRRRKLPAAAVAAQVGNDHPMPGGEMIDHRVEHFAGDHQPVHG
jgi:hypothetical protein